MNEAFPPSEALPSSSNPLLPRALWFTPLLIALAYLLFYQIAPRIRTESLPAILTATVFSLALSVWMPAQYAYTFRARRFLLISLALAVLINLPLRLMFVLNRPLTPWIYLLVLDVKYLHGLMDVLFIWLAASFGTVLSFLVRGTNMIPPIAAVLVLVDIWTVLLGGPVKQVIESPNPTAQAVTQAMTVRLPAPKVPRGVQPIQGAVGFADYLFIAFFVAGICRYVEDVRVYRRMLWTLIGVLSAYMLVVLMTGWQLPALVPMGVVMIALHWKYFHYERSEAFAMLYALLLLLVVGGAFWYFGRGTSAPVPKAP